MTNIVQQSVNVEIRNPVVSVVILRQPVNNLQLSALTTISSISNTQQFVLTGDECPIVIFYGVNNTPVANASAWVEVFPRSSNFVVSFSPLIYRTNETGIFTVCPLSITVSAPGSYTLFISSMGGGGNKTIPIVVSQPFTISRTDMMQYLAVGLIVFFSPLLFSSVPHSRVEYEVVGIFMTTSMLSLGIWGIKDIPNNPYYKGYYIFLLIAVGVTSLGSLIVAVVDALGYRRAVPLYRMRFINDEAKAKKVFRYAMWIINITPEKQSRTERICNEKPSGRRLDEEMLSVEPIVAEESTSVSSLRESLSTLKDKVAAKMDRKHKRRLQKTSRMPLKRDRPDLEVCYIPFGFYIVVTFTSVLLITLAFLIVYLFDVIEVFANSFISFLPSAGSSSQFQDANDQIVEVLCAGIQLVVERFPEISSLSDLIPRLKDINLLRYMTTLRENMALAVLAIQILFIVAGTISAVAVAFTLRTTHKRIPELILGIRRGTLVIPDAKIAPVESYIGLHVMALLLLQQLTFWLVVICGIILAIPLVRRFLTSVQFLLLVLTFGISFTSQKLVEEILIKRFLSDTNLLVVRPELYAMWHFAGLILGLFTGIVAVFVRWGSAVGLLTFTFASVEKSVMASSFSTLDKAHNGFMCSIVVEAKTGNPLMLLFATLLITKRELRRQSSLSSRSTEQMVVVDSLFEGDRDISSGVKNLARIYARQLVSSNNSTSLREAPVDPLMDVSALLDEVAWKRREKVRQRFWMWWLLTKNPSLRDDRKHALVFEDAKVCVFDELA